MLWGIGGARTGSAHWESEGLWSGQTVRKNCRECQKRIISKERKALVGDLREGFEEKVMFKRKNQVANYWINWFTDNVVHGAKVDRVS